MTIDIAMAMVSDMLWLTALVAGPILAIALLVGLLVSIFQVATQIQEMTLTFVPKMIAVFLSLFLLGHWIFLTITEFATALISNIPAYF